MRAKRELRKVKDKLKVLDNALDPEEIIIRVNWRDDGMSEWTNKDGSIEVITPEEYRKRGGIIIGWDDIGEDE